MACKPAPPFCARTVPRPLLFTDDHSEPLVIRVTEISQHKCSLDFLRLTKCTFHKFGTSGELEKHDALCILPLNIFNEKIYIFLWFWMLGLSALTSIVVVYR